MEERNDHDGEQRDRPNEEPGKRSQSERSSGTNRWYERNCCHEQRDWDHYRGEVAQRGADQNGEQFIDLFIVDGVPTNMDGVSARAVVSTGRSRARMEHDASSLIWLFGIPHLIQCPWRERLSPVSVVC